VFQCVAVSLPAASDMGSVLQCVAVCCSVLQCVAVWPRVVQCGTSRCSGLSVHRHPTQIVT